MTNRTPYPLPMIPTDDDPSTESYASFGEVPEWAYGDTPDAEDAACEAAGVRVVKRMPERVPSPDDFFENDKLGEGVRNAIPQPTADSDVDDGFPLDADLCAMTDDGGPLDPMPARRVRDDRLRAGPAAPIEFLPAACGGDRCAPV